VAGVSLFVYGTLLNDALVRQLTGRVFPKRSATLDGFERIAPPGDYPYITHRAGARVEGCLLDGVDAASLARFDAYEGDGYVRTTVEVTVGHGARVTCESYVGRR
jgi:gamma-glutamylcyclotransferase (GGCT)/AIG2-like uncharacterized protein YtfP